MFSNIPFSYKIIMRDFTKIYERISILFLKLILISFMDNFVLIKFYLDRKWDDFIQSNVYNFENIGFEVDDPVEKLEIIKELPKWEVSDLHFEDDGKIRYGVYFSDDESGIIESTRLILFLRDNIPNFEFEKLLIDNSNWEEEWKRSYRSFTIGHNILVKPSWEEVRDDKKYIIEIDPKMAFGTGTHETTSMCMEYVEDDDFTDKKILDIGCGTGILAILSSKLNAKKIMACDIDELAIESAKENSVINHTENIEVFYSDLFSKVDGKFDVIFANILSEILVVMISDVDKYLEEGGRMILSGIVEGREKIVEDALEEHGFKVVDKIKKNEWYLITAERKDV